LFGFVLPGTATAQDPATPYPLIDQGETLKISDHVYVILDDDVRFLPNVGIIVGARATLVIDTGVGERNGEILLQEARTLSANETFFIATTHYHTEHELGASAFPENAQMIRSRAAQQDVDELGRAHMQRFAGMSANLAELLDGAEFRVADVLFDSEYVLDLGGVSVRMLAVGPAHTRGDTAFFVVEDRVLFSGDVAMQRFPGSRGADYSVADWREALGRLADLDAEIVVPSHGPTGGFDLVAVYDDYFATIQTRARELKAEGRSADEVTERLMSELGPRYPQWRAEDLNLLGNAARIAYTEAP
jgi:glyoxylase-like metal-dependent hydrolase (beta-lactamase superfamily II)